MSRGDVGRERSFEEGRVEREFVRFSFWFRLTKVSKR